MDRQQEFWPHHVREVVPFYSQHVKLYERVVALPRPERRPPLRPLVWEGEPVQPPPVQVELEKVVV